MQKDYDGDEELETLCQLEDGTIVSYDAAHSTDEQVYDPKHFELIGIGHIHSVGGVLQSYTAETKEWFYRRVAA